MALSREEVGDIGREAAESVIPSQCREKCMLAGMNFALSTTMGGEPYVPTLFPINVAGLVKPSDLVIPHSELAMHVGAAGKNLLAWAVREDGRYARVVYENSHGCCDYAHGLPSELLSPELLRVTRDLLHIKES